MPLYNPAVISLTGTANQIIVSSPTGTVTLSLPQSIATASTPTFGGLTTPSVIGGTAVGSSLTLQSTSGVGTTDFIRFLVGDNGALEAGRFTNTGRLILGPATSTNAALDIFQEAADAGLGVVIRATRSPGNTRLLSLWSGGAGSVIDAQASTVGLLLYVGDEKVRITPTGAITFTTSANATTLTTVGYSLTGSSALSLMSLAGTLNTSGAPTVWDMNITQTASGAATLLMQIRDASTNYWKLTKAGAVTQAAALTIGSTAALSVAGANSRIQVGPGNVPVLVGIATNSVAAAAAEDGGVMIATVDSTLVYYSGGARYKVVGTAF